MAQIGEVNPDLVGAPGVERHLHQRRAPERLSCPPGGHCPPACPRAGARCSGSGPPGAGRRACRGGPPARAGRGTARDRSSPPRARLNAACSAESAASVFATTRQPEVSLSSRWTRPSRIRRARSPRRSGGGARSPRSSAACRGPGAPPCRPPCRARAGPRSSNSTSSGRSCARRPERLRGGQRQQQLLATSQAGRRLRGPAAHQHVSPRRAGAGRGRGSGPGRGGSAPRRGASPASSAGAVRLRVSLTCPALPDARLHVALRAEDDVDDGAIVEVRASRRGRERVASGTARGPPPARPSAHRRSCPARCRGRSSPRCRGRRRSRWRAQGGSACLGRLDERHGEMLFQGPPTVNAVASAGGRLESGRHRLEVAAGHLLAVEPELLGERHEDAPQVDRGRQLVIAARFQVLDVVARDTLVRSQS